MSGYARAMRQYASFRGRAVRAEFWQFMLVQLLIGTAATVADAALNLNFLGYAGPLALLWALVHLLPGIAVSVRRLHDIGRTGWWLCLALIPIVGALILPAFFLQRTKVGTGEVSAQAGRGSGAIIALAVFVALALLVARFVLFQLFDIPSGAMEPSVRIGDYLIASKYAYGYSKYTLPFAPVSGRIWGALPNSGDIVIFKYPVDNSTDYIKRVIGLAGDRVSLQGEILSINGKPASYEFVRDYTEDRKGRHVYEYRETLPNGMKHLMQTLEHTIDAPGEAFDTTVTPGAVFVLGDNRDDSADSRFWGVVPLENLVARAELVYFSVETVPGRQTTPEPEREPVQEFWRWPWTVRWDRLFMRLH